MSRLRSWPWCWIIVTFCGVFIENADGTRCPFCNIDFKVLGRHQWRCQSRGTATVTVNEATHLSPPTAPPSPDHNINNSVLPAAAGSEGIETDNTEWIACHCGRHGKGRRGLRAHQRHCSTLES